MPRNLLAAALAASLFSPLAAHAALVTGSFTGTLSGGTDTTGVFGTAGADLTGDAVLGTFFYNTSLFSQSVSAGTNTATSTGPGALSVTVTINGFSHTFTDQTSSSVFIDDGSVSGANEMTLQNVNNQTGGSSTVGENFLLDALDPLTPFITGTSLVQSFNAAPLITTGNFQILDTGPVVTADGQFTLSNLTLNGAAAIPTPEPASLAVLAVGVLGLAGTRRRRRGAVQVTQHG